MNTVLPAPVAEYLGPFELLRRLGTGSQAEVWLARDSRNETEVALKILRPERVPADVDAWLARARAVARLAHPNLVRVRDADLVEGRPALVLDAVDGLTLDRHLERRGRIDAPEAVGLVIGILDALQVAHAAGLVHRDLKPANVIVDVAGRARVTDFGLAAPIGAAASGIDGTPGYVAPEVAAGAPATAASDVFAAALVLGELLTGAPLVDASDPRAALRRVRDEDVTLPDAVATDDALRSVLLRALVRDPAERTASAEDFARALRAWDARRSGTGGGREAALASLLERMGRRTDFPALSDAMAKVQRLANSENEHLDALTDEILRDVALTNKLLRLVNTVHFASAGAGRINTISRAVRLIGLTGIRDLAMSLVLLDHMKDREHAAELQADYVRSLFAGSLADDLCNNRRDAEQVFVGALFQNLGRMLAGYYFPDEASAVRAAVAGGVPEEDAAARSLGVRYETFGTEVAKQWGLPDNVQHAMRKARGRPPTSVPPDAEDRMRWTAVAANEIADLFLKEDEAGVARELPRLAARFGGCLNTDPRRVAEVAERAREELCETLDAVGLQVAPESAAARLLRVEPEPGDEAPKAPGTFEGMELEPAASEQVVPGPVAFESSAAPSTAEVLSNGIQDISDALVEDAPLQDVLRMILETMYRALGFRRLLLCLRDAGTGRLVGRIGLGDGAAEAKPLFVIDPHNGRDLFAVVCAKGRDLLIRDASDPKIADRLPDWYRDGPAGRAFLLLPLMNRETPFGLIYADRDDAEEFVLGERELALLKTLRNQAVMAFRQQQG